MYYYSDCTIVLFVRCIEAIIGRSVGRLVCLRVVCASGFWIIEWFAVAWTEFIPNEKISANTDHSFRSFNLPIAIDTIEFVAFESVGENKECCRNFFSFFFFFFGSHRDDFIGQSRSDPVNITCPYDVNKLYGVRVKTFSKLILCQPRATHKSITPDRIFSLFIHYTIHTYRTALADTIT